MQRLTSALVGVILGASIIFPATAADLKLRAAVPSFCTKFKVDPVAFVPLRTVHLPPTGTCKPLIKNGLPIPDPDCSPGAVNPTLTLTVLQAKGFTTKCVRDQASSASEKQKTYTWYNIKKPAHNSGSTQVCELDHIISLELGGADTLENLWPQCGPNKAVPQCCLRCIRVLARA